MSKLLNRLSDSARSGVYRVSRDQEICDALSGSGHDLANVMLPPGKEAMLASIAASLAFPDWFGGNWDALEDCLTDLSWRKKGSHVFLFRHGASDDDLGILLDVLASAAEFWRERGQAFFAIFVDPGSRLDLPTLYREKAA